MRFEKDLNPTCVEDCFVLTNVPFSSSSYQGGVNVPYDSSIQSKSYLFYNDEAVIPHPRIGMKAFLAFGHKNNRDPGRRSGRISPHYPADLATFFPMEVRIPPSGLIPGKQVRSETHKLELRAQQSRARRSLTFQSRRTLWRGLGLR